jgi:hypothetical protein
VADRIVFCLSGDEEPGVGGFSGSVDFAAALHMAHEVPDQATFFSDMRKALKSKGRLLIVEPKFHVTRDAFARTVSVEESAGFQLDRTFNKGFSRNALMSAV